MRWPKFKKNLGGSEILGCKSLWGKELWREKIVKISENGGRGVGSGSRMSWILLAGKWFFRKGDTITVELRPT
jgi:hypothetical protein